MSTPPSPRPSKTKSQDLPRGSWSSEKWRTEEAGKNLSRSFSQDLRDHDWNESRLATEGHNGFVGRALPSESFTQGQGVCGSGLACQQILLRLTLPVLFCYWLYFVLVSYTGNGTLAVAASTSTTAGVVLCLVSVQAWALRRNQDSGAYSAVPSRR